MSRFVVVMTLLGVSVALLSLDLGGAWLGLLWLAADFLVVAFAYAVRRPAILGKRSDGTLAGWSWLLFLPYHLLNLVIWRAIRVISSEPAFHQVDDSLVIGRRLLGPELPHDFENLVDLTAEFHEPLQVRSQPGYVCLPTLDATAPNLDELIEMIANLKPGRTLIHCAQGHGRTGLVALAYLLSRGSVQSVGDGLNLIERSRPGVRLNREQLRSAENYPALFAKPSSTEAA